ncbi:MAG TPA: hypothetical protein VGI38_06790 [Puia sp.]
MKLLYSILFISDTILFIILSFFFLHLSDQTAIGLKQYFVLSGIILCIVSLFYVLLYYIDLPPSDNPD